MNDFSLDSWLTQMREAVDLITQLGRSVLETHRQASGKAAANADRWQLAGRLEDERQALVDLFDGVRDVVRSIEECRRVVRAGAPCDADVQRVINRCADLIEETVPRIEGSFVTIRHAALDLLRWTQRTGKIDDSTLPAEYRAAYARLIAHAPIIKPLTEALQEDLLLLKEDEGLPPAAQRLVSVLSRYNAVIDAARSFVRSVADPPLELVFHETEFFVDDVKSLSTEEVASVATELNDCCQLLLYDSAEFHRRVEQERPRLTDGLDASMVVLPVTGGFKVVFTVDEDPVFGELSVTLLRVLPENEVSSATGRLTQALYRHFSSE